MMSFLGHEGDKLSRIPISVNDMGTGLWATIGVLAALTRRAATGVGEDVSVSLYETAVAWSAVQIADYLASGKLPGRWGSGTAAIVPYQVFDSTDQPILVAAGNDGLFWTLCDALGAQELAEDPCFRTNSDRVTNRDALIERLSAIFRTRPSEEWLGVLGRAGVPCGLCPHRQTDGRASADRGSAPDQGHRRWRSTRRRPADLVWRSPYRSVGRTPKLGENTDLLDAFVEAVP